MLLQFCFLSIPTYAEPSQYTSWWQGYVDGIGQNFIGSYSGYNALRHAGAMGSTYLLVEHDIDQRYYDFFDNNEELQLFTFPAVIIGGLGAVALPAYMHRKGHEENDRQMQFAAYAVGQSVILSVSVTSIYKAFTGRSGTDINEEGHGSDDSHNFKFGFMRNGIFSGWPSGHATTAISVATSLTHMYPERKSDHLLWALGGLYIAMGISTNIHWLSDATSGILIGYGIGKTVGEHYYSEYRNQEKANRNINYYPIASDKAVGLGMIAQF